MGIPYIQIDLWLIILIIVAAVAAIALVVIYGIRAHKQQVSAGREELIGKMAEVITTMEPKGTVHISGEQWTAILDEGKAEPGEEVLITKVEGLKLRVTKKE
jgi:membrane-bound serine protease (ClpP class)